MKKILFSLIICFICDVEGEIRFVNSIQQQLCVQTLNTYGMFYSANLEERHEQTLHFLRQYDCDIILLQEVWEDDHYQNLVQLSQDINMRSVYFRKPSDDRRSGLVGLFKGGVQKSDVIYFSPTIKSGLDGFYKWLKFIDKGFGMAEVNIPWMYQNFFLVFNFHLNHISQTERISQLLLYLKWMLENSYKDRAIIAGGDFNFEPASLEFRIVKRLLRFKDPYEQVRKNPKCTHLCEDSGYDWSNFFVGESIRDYIFFRSSSKISFEPQDISIFPKNYNDVALSDHFGLRAIFQLNDSSRNHSENLVSEKVLRERVGDFEQILYEVESFLHTGDNTSSEISFIRSLYEDLKDSQSSVVQHLKY